MATLPLVFGGIESHAAAQARISAVPVYGTESLVGRRHQLDNMVSLRDVAGDGQRRARDAFIQLRGELVNGLRVQIREHDACPRVDEGRRQCPANTATGARDDGYFAVEIHRIPSSLSAKFRSEERRAGKG